MFLVSAYTIILCAFQFSVIYFHSHVLCSRFCRRTMTFCLPKFYYHKKTLIGRHRQALKLMEYLLLLVRGTTSSCNWNLFSVSFFLFCFVYSVFSGITHKYYYMCMQYYTHQNNSSLFFSLLLVIGDISLCGCTV